MGTGWESTDSTIIDIGGPIDPSLVIMNVGRECVVLDGYSKDGLPIFKVTPPIHFMYLHPNRQRRKIHPKTFAKLHWVRYWRPA